MEATAPLSSVTATLARAQPTLAALRHILDLISTFVDGCSRKSPERAVACRSLRLIDRITSQQFTMLDNPVDPALRLHWFVRAVDASIRLNELAILELLCERQPLALPRRCMEAAMASSRLEIVQFVASQHCDSPIHGECGGCLNGASFPTRIQGPDRVRVIEWLVQQGHVTEIYHRWGDTAASQGDLATVRWLFESVFHDTAFSAAITDASTHGHLEIIQFLHENGYTDDRDDDFQTAGESALVQRQDAVVEYFISHGLYTPSLPRSDDFFAMALDAGRIDLVEATDTTAYARETLEFQLALACQYGRLEVIQWLYKHKYVRRVDQFRDSCFKTSATALAVLEWMHSVAIGRVWTYQLMDNAARDGFLPVVQWLHTNRSEGCSVHAMEMAAMRGHLEVVQWLHSHRSEGCTHNAMDLAAEHGHLHVVQWLHSHRSEGCSHTAMDNAAARGHLDIVVWLHENRMEGCTTDAMDFADRLDVVQWLHTHRHEGCTPAAMARAAAQGDLPLMAFLYQYYPDQVDGDSAACNAASYGHLEAVQWLDGRFHGTDHFDFVRVHKRASMKDHRHILAWLDGLARTN